MRVRSAGVPLLCGILMLSGLLVFLPAVPVNTTTVSVDSDSSVENAKETPAELLNTMFYDNLGQLSNPDILYYGMIPEGMIGFGVCEIYLWNQESSDVITLSFVGSSKDGPQGLGISDSKTNFYLGDRGTYSTNAFNAVMYENLWDGISLHYVATEDGAKYEYHVQPGANPDDIQVHIDSFDSWAVGESSMRISTDSHNYYDDGLISTQNQIEIESEFRIIDDNCFGFSIGEYDISRPLIIDPLVYSSFIGGDRGDMGYSIFVDSFGYVYVAGMTNSQDFPLVNPVDSVSDPIYLLDLFIFKMSPSGDSLLFSTYFGGNNSEEVFDISVDSNGDVFVCGYTRSLDFQTLNARDPTLDGSADCFILKLNAVGDLMYSSFLGGSNYDQQAHLSIGPDGDIFITGSTSSSDFPTLNAYQSTYSGQSDIFITRLDSSTLDIVYSTYIGGWAGEYSTAIDVDSLGNAYVTGYVATYSGFTTAGAYDETHNGGNDAFVLKLNSTGNGLDYCTYVGGGNGPGSGDVSQYDGGYDIVVDSEGYAYVTGYTGSVNFPIVNGFDDTHGDPVLLYYDYDAFVFKLTPDGSSLVYSTFIGGDDMDRGYSIDIDSDGNAYVTGYTDAIDFPVMNPIDSTFSGERDCFVTCLNATGNGLYFSSYLGGAMDDVGRALSVLDVGSVYVTGYTRSSDFPLVNPFDDRMQYDEAFVTLFTGLTQADQYPPESTLIIGDAMIEPSTTLYTFNNAVFTLSAFDATSGVAITFYSINDGDWIEYSGPFQLLNEEKLTISYYSIDYYGNVEEMKSNSINLGSPALSLDIKAGLTDGSYNGVDSFDIILHEEQSGLYRIVATNPGQFQLTIEFINGWTVPLEWVIIEGLLPGDFVLKGANPYRVLLNGHDITADVGISSLAIELPNIPSGGVVEITYDFEYALKGSSGHSPDDFQLKDYVIGVDFRCQSMNVLVPNVPPKHLIGHDKNIASIVGLLSYHDGVPLVGIPVYLMDAYYNIIAETITDENGIYFFVDLEPAIYPINVTTHGIDWTSEVDLTKDNLYWLHFKYEYR